MDSDVYVAGYENKGSVSVAKYWKNGQAVALTEGRTSAWASSIAVVNGDVYVAGEENNGSVSVAKYWKNGQAVALTDGTKSAGATSIVVVKR
jgi:predicted heme/steroid binding protein